MSDTSTDDWDGVERRNESENLWGRRSGDHDRIHPLRWRLLVAWIIIFSAITFYSLHQLTKLSADNQANIAELQESKASNVDLRSQINHLSKIGCFGGRISTSKYNDLVQSIIDGRVDQLKHSLAIGDLASAQLHRDAISRYKNDFLIVSSVRQCNTPVVKPKFSRPG